MKPTRLAPLLGTIGAALGTFFAAFSTHDYALHLDRQLHGTHCSFVPGLIDSAGSDNACTAAMYSAYSALFRRALWGGIPIALLGLGAYAFFLVVSVALLISPRATSRRTWQAYGLAALTPAVASLVMFVISVLKVHAFCKLCLGMYFGSIVLAVAGVIALVKIVRPAGRGALVDPFVHDLPQHTVPMARVGQPIPAGPPYQPAPAASPMPRGSWLGPSLLFATLGAFVLLPAVVYAAAMPDYRAKIVSCGTIPQPVDKQKVLVHLATAHPKRAALLFVDPLCPTCKAFHERLVSEGIFEQLDVSVAIFPLDSDCNWMLDRSLHPGACELAKAFPVQRPPTRARCSSGPTTTRVTSRSAGKAGKEALRRQDPATVRRPRRVHGLEGNQAAPQQDVLQFAVANKVPVSTPADDARRRSAICDEDTDLGMAYTMKQIAPEVFSQ